MDKEEVISFIYMAADIYFKSKVKENSNDY